ncbi:MAG: prepilin peptidase [Oscillospiraceae bacterium]|nr:prepilin peptidase [Oscillospiraceae bacterium]
MSMIFSLIGLISAPVMALILNKMPARCFCDYDETPEARHNAPRAGKWAVLLSALILSAAFSILSDRFGVGLRSIGLCLSCVVLMMIALSDVRFCIIPDELIIAGCVTAAAAALPEVLSGGDWFTRLSPVLGALLGAAVILGINLIGRLVYKKDALGMGDLKLMVVCGILCGTVGTVIAMMAGILAAGVWFAVGIVIRRVRSEEYLPLGPFLIFGTMFTLCFRPMVDSFLAWYISLI